MPAGKPKGLPKSGGRQKGVQNKTSFSRDLHEKAAARGIDVFELLLDYCGPGEPELRLSAIKEMMKYLYPQLKAMDLIADLNVNPYKGKPLPELIKIAQEKLKK